MYATGVDTNYFQWGVGYYSPQSALYFSGTNFTGVSTDQYFDLGDLYYFNGTAWAGTQAYSVDLRTSLAFTAPSGITQDFDFNFGLINTLNTADPWASADSILLSANFPTTSFAVEGIDYTLTVGFGSATGSGYSEINEFYVLEDGSASAKLVGKITGKSVPDTGSTLALMAMAVVGVGGLRQYLTCKARLNCFR
jgi:hypothetical protein